MAHNIFTYGTLMFRPVWLSVTAMDCHRTTAIIKGFERRSLQGKVYPALIPSAENNVVKGVVYFDVADTVLEKLDFFEGQTYVRQMVQTHLEDNTFVNVFTYILKQQYYPILDDRQWDPYEFEKFQMTSFLKPGP